MDIGVLDAEATDTTTAWSKVQEARSTTYFHYVSQLLVVILNL